MAILTLKQDDKTELTKTLPLALIRAPPTSN